MKELHLIIISGLSGSGKSTALKTLEDMGFFCVDNLPILLLPKFIDLCNSSTDDISRVALCADIREKTFLKEYTPTLEGLRGEGYRIQLIFLESTDEVLIQRFSETRRQHPLSTGGSVREGITLERRMLEDLKGQADRIIDTSDLNVHQLRALFQEYFISVSKQDMSLTFMSFGFKHGIPHDADMVLDVRFLPNPYFVPELKELDGHDGRVSGYVLQWPETQSFIEKLKDFISFQIPLFEREGKSYLTVAVGCTGGRHRSVTLADYLKEHYSREREGVFSIHRDLEK